MNEREILAVMNSTELTDSERLIARWQFGLLGDFQTSLFYCIARADDNNLMALSLGFPEQVTGFREWKTGNLAAKLRSLGLPL